MFVLGHKTPLPLVVSRSRASLNVSFHSCVLLLLVTMIRTTTAIRSCCTVSWFCCCIRNERRYTSPCTAATFSGCYRTVYSTYCEYAGRGSLIVHEWESWLRLQWPIPVRHHSVFAVAFFLSFSCLACWLEENRQEDISTLFICLIPTVMRRPKSSQLVFLLQIHDSLPVEAHSFITFQSQPCSNRSLCFGYGRRAAFPVTPWRN